MDLAQIVEMKSKIFEEIRNIEALKQALEHTLQGLEQWERLLQSDAPRTAKAGPRRGAASKEVQPPGQTAVKRAAPSPIERVNRALSKIHGEFTRSQLLAETESDGKGEIPTGGYSNIFSRLLKNKRIEIVKGTLSQRDSLYVRSSERKASDVPPV